MAEQELNAAPEEIEVNELEDSQLEDAAGGVTNNCNCSIQPIKS